MMNSTSHPRGFTLLEMLIVVGLVALLSVGIAGVFDTVGETITRGKRVSELNRSAAQMERVMRTDFDRMTREGILLIRNEYANGGQNVSLFNPSIFDGEPKDRPRRIDEIMFFALNETGRFETARVPMHPDLIASSDTARIYYGHGKRPIRPTDITDVGDAFSRSYFRPEVNDKNSDQLATLGVASIPGRPNPNEYAADWAVLRQVMPLVSPGRLHPDPNLGGAAVAEMNLPDAFTNPSSPVGGLFGRSMLVDSRVQTAMQPSAQSVFRWLARQQSLVPGTPGSPASFREVLGQSQTQQRPEATSGLVDIAVTDLGEIASVINHAAVDRSGNIYWPEQIRPLVPFGLFFNPLSLSDREHMQAWMLSAMPGNSQGEEPGLWQRRTRIRYEYEPPLMSISDGFLSNSGPAGELERAYREADQVMLTSSVFVPRCTEFIVEWSYGLVDQVSGSPTFGQMIWYGLPRYQDVNENGSFDSGTDVILAQPFNGVDAFYAVPALVALTGRPQADFNQLRRYPTRALINMGMPQANIVPSARTEVSMFGYYDPGPGALRSGGGGVSQVDPDDRSWDSQALTDPSDDRPWLWPALIRVTMTIADATDPTIEATHQIVFEVPDGGLDNE
jgi:prepilin-type N-terminal cleavage/methylation domain-containing protein